MNEVIHVLPDTAVSVLEMFSPTKQGIISFASQVINEVEDGKREPLQILLLCKTIEEVAEKIRKGTTEAQQKEAAKYGEKPFMFNGAELHYTATKTEYKYDNCNDPVLENLFKIQAETKKQLDERQAFLKALPVEGQTIVNDETGEVTKVRPPAKFQSMGVKVSLK